MFNTIRNQHLHFSFEEKLKEGDTINLKLKQDDWLYANSLHRISFKGELLYVEDNEMNRDMLSRRLAYPA